MNISNGDFVFSLTESYLIEDGKLTAPLKGVNLIGNGPDVLRRVDMLGSDFELSDGIWTCGKDGQSVPVGVGTPTVQDRRDHGGRDPGMSGGAGRPSDDQGAARRRRSSPCELAKKAGADDAEVLVRDGTELTAKVRLGEPELVKEAGSRALGLRVLKDSARARHVHVAICGATALEALVRRDASTLARLAEPDELTRCRPIRSCSRRVPELDL